MSQVSSDRRSRLSGFALPVLFLLAGSALAQVPEAIEANMKKMLTAFNRTRMTISSLQGMRPSSRA